MRYHILGLRGGLRGGLSAGLLAALLFSAPALSQEPEAMVFCEYQPALDELVGVYQVQAGPSLLSANGQSVPLPSIQTFQVTLAMIDGVLVQYADGIPAIDLLPAGGDEPDWHAAGDIGGTPVVGTEDMEILLGCDVNSLVRLVGTGIGTSQEGRQFEFTIRLFAVLDGQLVGDNSWTIDGMTMRQRLVYAEIGG